MAVIEPEKEITPISGHSLPFNELITKLDTEIENGLYLEEVIKRQTKYGPNIIPKPHQSFFQVYIAPLTNTLIVVYLIMTTLITLLGLVALFLIPGDYQIWFTALQWLIIVGVNFAIAIVQQARAQKKIEALHKLAAPEARVIRNGKEIEILTEEVVPGDIIKISQGDKVPADSRLIKSTSLRVNEASLTGESVPAHKFESGDITLDEDTPIGERKNMIYSGTFITFGSGKAIVVNTGGRTEFGKISLELEALNTGEIPIKAKVNTIGNFLSAGMAIVFILLIIYQGALLFNWIANSSPNLFDITKRIITTFSSLIITAMSVVPINIPLLTTIVLITGVLAMAKHNVIIRNLASIESLGRISILCSDKTGTITAGQMTVKRIYDATTGKNYYVTGLGYAPFGKIVELSNRDLKNINERDLQTLDPAYVESGSSLEMMVMSGYLNNDSQIIRETLESTGQETYDATGNPTEAALLTLFNKSGLDVLKIKEEYEVQREYPFDSSLKRMSKIYKDKNGKLFVFCKGASEIILPRCSSLGFGNKKRKIKTTDIKNIENEIKDFASLGYRLLSLAYKEIDKLPKKDDKEREIIEDYLSYLGFIAVLDPPREKVDDSVRETLNAGITPIMITGDSPLTARSIANNIGMIYLKDQHLVHEGKMAAELNDDDFINTRVFARVAPEDKRVIVERYQKNQRVVAMTGDGVNDALALSMADAGIAMGITGTEVSKQAADLVIADDSFNSIVTGIREGRALFQRIRVIIFFYICVNLAEAVVYIGTSFLSNLPGFEGFILLDNLQRVYIFGIAHSLPPLALIIDQVPRDIMDRTPIDTAGIFNRKLAITLIVTSASFATVVYIVYFSAYYNWITVNENFVNQFYVPIFAYDDPTGVNRPLNWNHAKARTMMHTIIYIAIPLIVLSIRRIDKSIIRAIKDDSSWITYILAFSIIPIHLVLMYIKEIQNFIQPLTFYLDIIALDFNDWIICIIAAIIPVVCLEITKFVNRMRGEYY